MKARLPIEAVGALYFITYIPYAVAVRWMATIPYAPLGRPLTGLEILPAATLLSGVLTLLYCWACGWSKAAHHRVILGVRVPMPTRWTTLSGIGTAMLLITVPLSFTFQGVSIPFMQLLMRGDVLVIAPLVDMIAGRRVRVCSWIALALVAAGLILTVRVRNGLNLPPLAVITVALYTLGYFVRLGVMTRIAKTKDPQVVRAYFVEEKIVAIPVAVGLLALLAAVPSGIQGGQLEFGFIDVWRSGQMAPIAFISVLLLVISVLSILILLDTRENSFCVPIERSSSILAGIAAAVVLAKFSLGPVPTREEFMGAALMVLAVLILSIGPRVGTLLRKSPAPDRVV